MSNTLIQLKHSVITDIPPSLNTAEPAYSFTSNTLFIGLNGAVINIGGQFYTSQIDDATDLSVGGTLVRRDATGSVTFNVITANTINAQIEGNANTATQLQTSRFFNFTGDVDPVAVSFNGTSNADFTLELTNTGVTSGTYGGTTQIPVITVDEDGRITSASNTSISTDLNISADTGSNVISLATDTLTFVGGDGVTTTIGTTDHVEFSVDNTVIRTTGGQTIGGNLNITGNLNVTGNVITFGAEDLIVNDPIIILANNNTGNVLDIGFVGKYANGNQKELGLIHHASTDKFYLFTGYEGSVESTNVLNIADPTIVRSTLVANLEGGTVSGLASAISVSDGGTGSNTFTSGEQIVYDGTKFTSLANVITTGAGTLSTSNTITSITTDGYGRLISFAATPIVIDTSQITTGILGVERGGTGANTFTTNGVLLGQGTGAISTVSSSTEGHILTINSSGVPEFRMLSGGTF